MVDASKWDLDRGLEKQPYTHVTKWVLKVIDQGWIPSLVFHVRCWAKQAQYFPLKMRLKVEPAEHLACWGDTMKWASERSGSLGGWWHTAGMLAYLLNCELPGKQGSCNPRPNKFPAQSFQRRACFWRISIFDRASEDRWPPRDLLTWC